MIALNRWVHFSFTSQPTYFIDGIQLNKLKWNNSGPNYNFRDTYSVEYE